MEASQASDVGSIPIARSNLVFSFLMRAMGIEGDPRAVPSLQCGLKVGTAPTLMIDNFWTVLSRPNNVILMSGLHRH
jgi:hypothetical protein